MCTPFLKGNRTRYLNLLQNELEKGKLLLEEDEYREWSLYIRDVDICIKRLNDFVQKLEEADERLSTAIEGQDGAQEVETLIREDWEYISTVTDCRDELMELLKSSQDQRPTDNWSSATVTEDRFNQMVQLTSQMQQVIIGQQQLQQQQQISKGKLKQ